MRSVSGVGVVFEDSFLYFIVCEIHEGRSSSSLLVMSGLKSCSKAGGLVELFMNGFTLLFVGGGFWAVWAT